MKEIYHQYLNNVMECHRLAKANRFPVTESDDSVLDKIATNARRAYGLRLENDAILNELIYSRSAETLTASDIVDLKEFADTLLTPLCQDDAGIAYKVHCLLFEYAKLTNDQDLYIRELYHLGICLFYLSPTVSEFGINMYGKTCTAYLREGASYLTKLEEIESEITRSYVIRCIANLYLTDENINGPHNPGTPCDRVACYMHFRDLFAEIIGVMESPYYHELVPSFNWEDTIYKLHFNRCLYYFNFQRSDLPHIVEDMLESAQYLHDHKRTTSDHSTVDGRIDYVYVAANRRAGRGNVSDIVDVLLRDVENAKKDDYSANGVTLNLQLPLYLEYTYKLLPEAQKKKYSDQVHKAVEGIPRYLKNIPINEYNNVVNEIVSETIRYCVQIGEPVSKRLFNYLLYCHAPTYIHITLTASIAKKLFERMIETCPQKAVGVFGTTCAEELIEKKAIYSNRVYECALCHDVGKIMLLNYVEIYNRKLLDEEFQAITLHSQIASLVLKNQGRDDVYYTALYHHCYNDLSGGYPKNLPPCPPEYKLIADIAAVSDSLEAATDNVGRCYAASKAFDDVVDEFRNFCPSRYSSDVVALFDDESFFKRIKNELQTERREIYLDIYREKT